MSRVCKLDRLIIGDRLFSYTKEMGLKTWCTGSPTTPTKLNQGGYTGSVSEMPPLRNYVDYSIVDTSAGYYTTQFSYLRFPVYNRYAHGIMSFGKEWTFNNAYALGTANQDPYDDFDYRPYGGYDNTGADYILGYTTLDGGWLPTMSYEGLREGIRDDKYLSTLNSLVKSSGDSTAVSGAKSYLASIKQKIAPVGWYENFFWKARPQGFYELILGVVSSKGEDDFEYFTNMREDVANYIININGLQSLFDGSAPYRQLLRVVRLETLVLPVVRVVLLVEHLAVIAPLVV
jgi:hypothetical protein